MKTHDIVNDFINELNGKDVKLTYRYPDTLIAEYQSGFDLYDVDPDSLEYAVKSSEVVFGSEANIIVKFNSFGELTPVLSVTHTLSKEDLSSKKALTKDIQIMSSKAYSILEKLRRFEKIDSMWNGEY